MKEQRAKSKEQILENVEQMRAWARDFAKKLTAPCVVALHGDLGMGKSEIARTVIQTLRGADTVVPSPTFTIVQSYDGISHFDLYRFPWRAPNQFLLIRTRLLYDINQNVKSHHTIGQW